MLSSTYGHCWAKPSEGYVDGARIFVVINGVMCMTVKGHRIQGFINDAGDRIDWDDSTHWVYENSLLGNSRQRVVLTPGPSGASASHTASYPGTTAKAAPSVPKAPLPTVDVTRTAAAVKKADADVSPSEDEPKRERSSRRSLRAGQ